ncbi:unnamed protein product [Clonostachys byssicola]|uniref:Rhodopsin domain-containing protein n=1 Tax=Clonostachys byssicola TaxID=160290 RepID=A0A9N9YBX8_9HYPO|nr:unnamed protein product [Clonostachys byssicola]
MWYFAGVPLVPQNRVWFITVFAFTCLAFVVVLMRLYSRVILTRLVGFEDWLIFLAMGFSIAYIGTVVHEIELGLGYGVNPDDMKSFLHTEFFTTLIYTWSQWIIKLSISVLYYRIFSTAKPRKIIRWIIAWFVVYGLVNCIAPIFCCIPVRKFWDHNTPGYCIEWGYLHYTLSAVNIANDFLLLVFPIPILVKLNASARIRVILVVTLTCGLVASIASILRLQTLVTFFSATRDKRPILGSSITTWSSLEINLAIICSSVASLKPLFARFIGLIPHSEAKSTDRNTRGYQPPKQHSDQSWIPLERLNERTQTTWYSIDDVEAEAQSSKFWDDQDRQTKTSIVAGQSSGRR